MNDPLFGHIVEQINKNRGREESEDVTDERILLYRKNGELKKDIKDDDKVERTKRGHHSPPPPPPPVVISFSHFLPLQDLLPEKRMLHYPNLAKASGSTYLAKRVLSLKPHVHIFGHTHFTQDQTIDKIRFVQWPLGYPRDQMRRRDGGLGWEPLVVWDSEIDGGLTPQKNAYWSEYYRKNQRMPHIIDKAPWVVG